MPEEEESRAVVVVGARLGDDVDDAGAGAAHLGGELVGGDLELLHAVLREVHQRSADHFVVVVGAIYGDVATATKGAGRRSLQRVRLRGIIVRGRPVSWQQEGQLQEVASVQRDVLDGRGR